MPRELDHFLVLVLGVQSRSWRSRSERAQFESNMTAIWFKFDVGGQETEAPQGPNLPKSKFRVIISHHQHLQAAPTGGVEKNERCDSTRN